MYVGLNCIILVQLYTALSPILIQPPVSSPPLTTVCVSFGRGKRGEDAKGVSVIRLPRSQTHQPRVSLFQPVEPSLHVSLPPPEEAREKKGKRIPRTLLPSLRAAVNYITQTPISAGVWIIKQKNRIKRLKWLTALSITFTRSSSLSLSPSPPSPSLSRRYPDTHAHVVTRSHGFTHH